MSETPRHEYETIDGSRPTAHGTHDPRTIEHTVTKGDDTDLMMMSEIGDGVFVQWSNCRKCNKRVSDCSCKGGPVEPSYMKTWRDQRFARDLNTRPDPDRALLDRVLAWAGEMGYTVTKKDAADSNINPDRESATDEHREMLKSKALPEATSKDDLPSCPKCGELGYDNPDDCSYCEDQRIAASEGVDTQKVDAGLDAALEKVRATRDLSEHDPGF